MKVDPGRIHEMRILKMDEMDAKLKSWFLGPKAENADIFERLVLEALRDCVFWRRNFHPEDEFLVPESVKRDKAFQDSVGQMTQHFQNLLADLKRGIPFYSPRYIGHMLGDQLLPAVLGYFAAMLHNPNNVSHEGSPMTSRYEIEVGRQLARLMGYGGDAWGHITSGGTIANFEALWVARNLKYLPLAANKVAEDLRLDIEIRTPGGDTGDLASVKDAWVLLNLDPDEVLEILPRLRSAYANKSQGLTESQTNKEIEVRMARHSISGLGIHRFFSESGFKPLNPGLILMPATAHYSLKKVVEALGMGCGQIELIPIDSHFRMDIGSLRERLRDCLDLKRPVIALTSVVGSTEEGAVDQIHEVSEIQEEFRREGLSFYHHCDAAWGGYARTLFCEEDGTPVRLAGDIMKFIRIWPSDEIFKSFSAIHTSDSVTIDPHKLGYIPYPCGTIVFRNDKVKDLISFDAPYIFSDSGNEESSFIGRHILEGSKPGAAAAACWLAHKVVPLNQSGYGQLIGKSIQGAQELYLKCEKDLSLELASSGIKLRVLTDPPDINLICFIVNKDGNSSLSRMNELNKAICDELKFDPAEITKRPEFMISSTEFTYDQYGLEGFDGKNSMDEHLQVLGISSREFGSVGRVSVLRCTIINPWFALSRGGKPDYIEAFATTLKATIDRVVSNLSP